MKHNLQYCMQKYYNRLLESPDMEESEAAESVQDILAEVGSESQ